MRWCVIGALAMVGCGPRVVDDGTVFEEGSGGGSTVAAESSGDESTEDEGSSGTEDEACPVADPMITFALTVEFPGNDLPTEGGELERNASCTVSGGEGGPGYAELVLDCREEETGSDVSYRIAFENEDDPFGSWIDWEETIELQYERWHHYESGGGESLALSQDGLVHLVVHNERTGGGLVGVCADSQGSARISAQDWLWKFDASINHHYCAEGTLFRLGVTTRDGGANAFPGTRGVLEDVSYVYPQGVCFHTDGGSEDWDFSVLLWR